MLTEILRIVEFYSGDEKFLGIVEQGDPNGDIRLSNMLGRLAFFIKNRDSPFIHSLSCIILGNFAIANRSIVLDLFRADRELLKACIALFPTEEESLENALWILSDILISQGREENLRVFAENLSSLLEQAESTKQESNQLINHAVKEFIYLLILKLLSLLKGLGTINKDPVVIQALHKLNSIIES